MGSTRRRLNVPEDKKILILKRIKIYDHILHDEKYPNVGKRMQKWKEIFEYCKQLEVSINNVRHLQQLFRYVIRKNFANLLGTIHKPRGQIFFDIFDPLPLRGHFY